MYGNRFDIYMQILLGSSLYILYSKSKGFKFFESQTVRDMTVQLVS